MTELTRSAEKRQFFKRLNGVGEISDSEDEAVLAAESFVRNARPRSSSPHVRARRTNVPSSSAPDVSALRAKPKAAVTEKPRSKKQSNTDSVRTVEPESWSSKSQPKASAVEDSTSDTRSDTGSSKPTLNAKTIDNAGNEIQYDLSSSQTVGDVEPASESPAVGKFVETPASKTKSDAGSNQPVRRVQTLPTKAKEPDLESSFKAPPLKHSSSAPPVIMNIAQAKRGRKRRKIEEPVIAEHLQIFKGKTFCKQLAR
jgi:hypothetical protein